MNWADKCCGKALNWLLLSNSGDTLKLMIPSYSRKIICGQNNYLGKVTSHKIDEKKMGYRGSKSGLYTKAKYKSVKEQRVDGSRDFSKKVSFRNNMQINNKVKSLRCTLMGFERNYQFKIPTNQLINRLISTLSGQPSINPYIL